MSTNNVFTDPSELVHAVLEIVNPGPIRVQSMKEQLTELIRPGCAIGFRTESGSLYDMTVYTTGKTILHKVEHDGPRGLKRVAFGQLIGAHDSKRDVYGIAIKESSGRMYTTSAVVKAWLAYDATTNTFHNEPA